MATHSNLPACLLVCVVLLTQHVAPSLTLPDWVEAPVRQNAPLSWGSDAIAVNLDDYIPGIPEVPKTRASILLDLRSRVDKYFRPIHRPPKTNGTLMLTLTGKYRGMDYKGTAAADSFWVFPGSQQSPRGRGVASVLCSSTTKGAPVVRVADIQCNVLMGGAAYVTSRQSSGDQQTLDMHEVSCGRDCAGDLAFNQRVVRAPFIKYPVSVGSMYRSPVLAQKIEYPAINFSAYNEWVFNPLGIKDLDIDARLQSISAAATSPRCTASDSFNMPVVAPLDALLFTGGRVTCVVWNGILTSVYWDEMAAHGGLQRVSCSPGPEQKLVGQVLFPSELSLDGEKPFMFIAVSQVKAETRNSSARLSPTAVISFYQKGTPGVNNRNAAQLSALSMTQEQALTGDLNAALASGQGSLESAASISGGLSYTLKVQKTDSSGELIQNSRQCTGQDPGGCFFFLTHGQQGILEKKNMSLPVSKLIPDTRSKTFCSVFRSQPSPEDPKIGAGEIADNLLEDMITFAIRLASGADNTQEVEVAANSIEASLSLFNWVAVINAASTTVAGVAGFVVLRFSGILRGLHLPSKVLESVLWFSLSLLFAITEAALVSIASIVLLSQMVQGRQQQATLTWQGRHLDVIANYQQFDYYLTSAATLSTSVDWFIAKVVVLSAVIALALGVSLFTWFRRDPEDKDSCAEESSYPQHSGKVADQWSYEHKVQYMM